MMLTGNQQKLAAHFAKEDQLSGWFRAARPQYARKLKLQRASVSAETAKERVRIEAQHRPRLSAGETLAVACQPPRAFGSTEARGHNGSCTAASRRAASVRCVRGPAGLPAPACQ